ncbi:unnamed protein product [Oikopleura dioica]|uniref:Uncharacterized protein n=1 Tax=Oikopleura dioica TaxID=34765 RepID=E4WRA2_OIKDI|nr:unnamed protein product [Oikopleura dioica]
MLQECVFVSSTIRPNGVRLGAQLSDGSVADISAQYPDLKSLISEFQNCY